MDISSSREELCSLGCLPLHNGGLGIPTLTGLRAHRSRIITTRRSLDFVEENYPELAVVLRNDHPVHDDAAYGQLLAPEEDLVDAAEVGAGAVVATLRDNINSSRGQVARLEKEKMELHAKLLAEGRHGHAATLLSGAAQGTAAWIYARYFTSKRFTESEFREALRSRLLSPFEPPHGRLGVVCRCYGVGHDLVREPTHPTVCKWGKGIITKRHDRVRDELLKALHRMHPQAQITSEPLRHNNPDMLPVRRPDIGSHAPGILAALSMEISCTVACSMGRLYNSSRSGLRGVL